MTNREHPDQRLAALLLEEIKAASTLLDLLRNESTELASNNPTPDAADNQPKLQLINALQQATHARMNHMSVHGPTLENGRLAETAETLAGNDSLQPLFSQLAKLAQQCFEENRLIGQLINRRAQFVTRILDSLAPQTRNAHAEIYGESGDTSTGTNNGLVNLTQ
ncbi:MAG: flagellar protein FlgN [Gammaproteobacteria bacterium]|nr:flagellar protein FlgN [Gammaproteobacteria bacterium]